MSSHKYDFEDSGSEDDLSDNEHTTPQKKSKRQRCPICHHYKYTIDLAGISPSKRATYEHRCSHRPCRSLEKCPTTYKSVSEVLVPLIYI